METDTDLLARYARHRDADAFAALVQRYAGMVFTVALRITGNSHDAEDVAQSCFLDLARQASSIHSSLPGWLHAAATHRSSNQRRDDSTRRTREAEAPPMQIDDTADRWEQIRLLIDAAIDRLPEELRLPLVMHYLQDQSQAQIAQLLAISQPTVSRRLADAIHLLRSDLSKLSLLPEMAAVLAQLKASSAIAVPPALIANLGKIAVAGLPHTSASPPHIARLFLLHPVVLLLVVGLIAGSVTVPIFLSWSGPTARRTISVPPPKPMLQKITRLRMHRIAPEDAVVVVTADDQRSTIIVIGAHEADPLAPVLTAPMAPDASDVYSATVRALATAGWRISQLTITQIKAHTFSALLQLQSKDQTRQLDCRPSDGLNLALRASASLLVESAVLDDTTLLSPAGAPLSPEDALKLVQKIPPPKPATSPDLPPPTQPVKLAPLASDIRRILQPHLPSQPLLAVTTAAIHLDASKNAALILHLENSTQAVLPLDPLAADYVFKALYPATMPRPMTFRTISSLFNATGLHIQAILLPTPNSAIVIFSTPSPPMPLAPLDAICLAFASDAPLLIRQEMGRPVSQTPPRQ